MGILILVLATILTVELVRRAVGSWNQETGAAPTATDPNGSTMVAPAGSRLADVTATGSRAVLWFELDDGRHRLVFVNPRTAEITGSLDIGAN